MSYGIAGYNTRMLLQVHDELVLESPPEEAPEVMKLIKHEMESVHKLRVPFDCRYRRG